MDWEPILKILGLIYPLFMILGALCSFDVILKNRTAQGTIAWVICLVLFPILAVPLYLVFGGRKFYGYIKARRKDEEGISHIGERLITELLKYESENFEELKALTSLARLPVTGDNTAEYFLDGGSKFEAVFRELAKAEKYIVVQYYMVHNDDTGREFKKILLEKAAAGISVYFLYDNIGSYELSSSYLKSLKAGGVNVAYFGGSFVRNKFQINFRNHRKIIVIDGVTAFCGGMNVGDEYRGRHPKLSPWRDTHLLIRGSAVQSIQLTFLEDWYSMTRNIPELEWTPVPGNGNNELLVFPFGPADERYNGILSFIHACNLARERLWIVSPYFVPPPEVTAAIELAAVRGVDVRIMVPSKVDNIMVQLSSLSFIDEFQKTGVKFYRYKEGFLHQKVFLVDDGIASVGTMNVDNRSFNINFEMNVIGFDKDFVTQMSDFLEKDFANCALVEENEFARLPFLKKLASRASRLLSPLQ